MASITIRGLTKRYRPAGKGEAPAALSGLDLEIADGELLVLVGPSGCGKSTALRLIAGLEQPDAGRVELGGRDLAPLAPQERDIAMVFQGYALYPHLRVREIIAFPLEMRGVPRAERAKKVRETAELVGLGALLERRPAELSGGEQQRVAMARAIVRSPKAFLFDEPLSNLDAKLRAELRVELGRLVRRLGVTSIYVTHDQAEAMTLGDRIAVLRAGRLQQVGPPREIYERPANTFVAGFLGTPMMNLVDLECEAGRGHAPGLELPLPLALARRRRLTLGVRPEHVAVGLAPDGKAGAAAAGGSPVLAAEVVAVEPLGAESYLYLELGGTALRARLPGLACPALGERVSLRLEPSRLAWFDAETGERLATRAAEEP